MQEPIPFSPVASPTGCPCSVHRVYNKIYRRTCYCDLHSPSCIGPAGLEYLVNYKTAKEGRESRDERENNDKKGVSYELER